jgi:hypothetical protein
MTTRRWMMVVMVVSLILGSWKCLQRRAAFLELADQNAWLAEHWNVHRQRYLDSGTPMFNELFFDSDDVMKEPYFTEFQADSKRHAALARKYRYAAAHPWLPVEPDPPKP